MDFVSTLIKDLHQLEWLGSLVARLSVGVLFALSGGGKLFVQKKGEEMEATVRKAGVPSPAASAKILSTIEFTFGLFLAVGFLTPVSCILLMGMMVVALITTVLPGVKESSFIAWVSAVLYLPEVLYLVILFWLLLAGPGRASVDHLIGS